MKKIIILIVIFFIHFNLEAQNLTLQQCKNSALENNKRIKEAKLKVKASEEVKKQAFTNYFPQVSAGATATKFNDYLIDKKIPEMNLPVYDGNPASLANPTQFTYFPRMELQMLDYMNMGFVTALQPVYFGGKIKNGNKLAEIGKEISNKQLNLTKDEIIVRTEELYWLIVSLKEKNKTLNSYNILLDTLLKDVSVAYDAGLIQRSDLLKVQIKQNEINTNRLKLNNGIELSKMALAQHIGIKYSENISLGDTVVKTEKPETLLFSHDEALKNRAEYQMLTKAVEAEILQKRMAMGDNLPSLAVGISAFATDFMEESNTNAMAFATLSIPISGWWGGSHKMKEHKIKEKIAQNNLDEKSELLKLQMANSYNKLTEQYEQIKLAELSLQQTREHLKVIKDNYDSGINGTSDLLEAQAMLQNAKDAVVDAKTNYKIKQIQYLKTTARINKN